jgi:hypothetical protein
VEYLIRSLVKRRDKIGRVYFSMVLPIDNVTIANGRLKFDDLAVTYGFQNARTYTYEWSTFNNETEARSSISGSSSDAIPRTVSSGYSVVRIKAEDPKKFVDVYLRHKSGQPQVVGVERHW